MTITITQQPNTQNLYLYPNGDISTQLSKHNCDNNYQCVDETWYEPDEDSTFVYSTSVSATSDLYSMQNHTSETGTINYVKVISRSKSNIINQDSSGTYVIIVGDGTITTESINFSPMVTSYKNNQIILTEKPSGGAWNWSDIDNLSAGIKCSSPTIYGSTLNLVLRPNGQGNYTELNKSGCDYNWQCVDESDGIYSGGHDGYNTYVYSYGGGSGSPNWKLDSYAMENHTIQQGTINYVKVVGYFRTTGSSSYEIAKLTLFDGTNYCSMVSHNIYTGSWYKKEATFYLTYLGNPFSWSDIDNIQTVIELSNYWQRLSCTQVYLIVNYEADYNPEIRTTQLYAVVNYDPAESTVTLNMPESLDVSHGRSIKRHVFQSGNYSVDDFGRGGKTLHIRGTETNDVYNTMNALRNMCHYDAPVTVAGLPDTHLNTDYRIMDFNFKREAGDVCIYNWDLTLEET